MALDPSEQHPVRRPQQSPAVWRPADLITRDWCIELTDEQRQAVVEATRIARHSGITAATAATMGPAQFPLPTLAVAIGEWSQMLSAGRGFVLLRGFPVDLLDDESIEIAYTGLGVHLGRPVSQNAAGELLTHIRDERLAESGPAVRLYRTRHRQDFHTDGADIIGLLCLQVARSGGQSRIVSSGAIYNELLRRRPDLLEVLYRPMHWDRQGDDAAGGQPWFTVAPFTDIGEAAGGGEPRLFYVGWYIRDAQRHAAVPRLTAEQIEAMELLESIANDPGFHVEMEFRPGDIQLLNNGRILHSREAYEDDDDPQRRRHLLRLWLAAHTFAGVEEGLRFGIAEKAPG